MRITDIGFADVTALGKWYRDGTLTPADVVEQALRRLAELEPTLNAFANPMSEMARTDARRATVELASGLDLGPMHGIPVAIKDLIEVVGVPTGYGSRVQPSQTASRDATLVARLRSAGAILLGKTNLLEYAYGVAHPEVRQTNNPHDPGRTAGGSSGGSAAAVAAGIVPLAVGTDTGGSIRIPAAYCGIVGLKPSFGLVPLEGVFPLSWSLDHAGPLARNAEDAALLLSCLSCTPMPINKIALGDIRIGLVQSQFSTSALGRAVTDRVNVAIKKLRRGGAQFSEVSISDLDFANRNLITILQSEAAVIHAELYAHNAAGYAAGTRAQIEAGSAVPATDYVRARRFQTRLRDSVEGCFSDVDVLLAPSVPYVAPFEDPQIEEEGDSEMLSSGFANMTGHPSVSIPCGTIEGLPLGMQLTGPAGKDAKLLSAASIIAEVQNF